MGDGIEVRAIGRRPRDGVKIGDLLSGLLAEAPASLELSVALSPADLACSDSWVPPAGIRKAKAKLGSALVEGRCLSESLEMLACDICFDGAACQAVAISRETLDSLLVAAKGFPVRCVTSIPAALAQAFGTASLDLGGDHVEVGSQDGSPSWRSWPVERPDGEGTLSYRGQNLPPALAAAAAAAHCDPERVPNLLHAFPAYRKTFVRRFRDPLLSVAWAGVLCLIALGMRFHREIARDREELAVARRAEAELWSRFLPAEEPREGRLLGALRRHLEDLGESGADSASPSALAFWGEIGRQMPDPEALGLTLESLDLAPDGGRLNAHLPAAKEDPLKNASQLEAKLNQSGKMTARGDYEVRDGQVQVRLRMDYKP